MLQTNAAGHRLRKGTLGYSFPYSMMQNFKLMHNSITFQIKANINI